MYVGCERFLPSLVMDEDEGKKHVQLQRVSGKKSVISQAPCSFPFHMDLAAQPRSREYYCDV